MIIILRCFMVLIAIYRLFRVERSVFSIIQHRDEIESGLFSSLGLLVCKRGNDAKQQNENNYNFALLKCRTHTHTNYFRHICMNSLRFAYDSD